MTTSSRKSPEKGRSGSSLNDGHKGLAKMIKAKDQPTPHWKTALATVALLAAACGGDTTSTISDASPPSVTVQQSTSSTVSAATSATTAEEEPGIVASEPVECPEGTRLVGEDCRPEPDETLSEQDAVSRGTEAQKECEAEGGIWDVSGSVCTQPDTSDVPPDETEMTDEVEATEESTDTAAEEVETGVTAEELPSRVVVWEGVDSEGGCLVAGGTWGDDQCSTTLYDNPEGVELFVYWRPSLIEDAYNAVDPDAVDADQWDHLGIGGPWGFSYSLVFFHYNEGEEEETQDRVLREAVAYAAGSVFTDATEWVYFPYSYEVSWADDPNIVSITGTYPLGEERTLFLNIDPQQRGAPNVELPLPHPPPIRPTTPFAPAAFPETADEIGRICPPVEEVWGGYGAEVTDPCTLKAIELAVDWMWRGDAPWRQRAIRDGHAMIDFLQEIDDIEDPYLKATLGFDSRTNGWTHIREVVWAGRWPGASMIYLEWVPSYPQRELTPEEQEAKVRHFRNIEQQGYEVPSEYFGDEQLLSDLTVAWRRALMVRTADGTWRMSYRSVCDWYAVRNLADRGRLLCPDDPNPHFPDSALFDYDIYPPSHKNYFQDRRASADSIPHQDGGLPRDNDQYLGVPPHDRRTDR